MLHTNVVKGLFDTSDHNVVLVTLRIRGRWEFSKNNGEKGVDR